MWNQMLSRFGTVGTTDQIIDSSNHSDSTDDVIDLKGDQNVNKTGAKQLNLSYKDLWALALTTAVGGHYLTWNEGLTAGFGSYLAATIVIASGYVCLLSCLAELSSALPFAGGAYGIARVTLGIFPGFMVACLDCFKSVLYVSSAAGAVGRLVTYSSGADRSLGPLSWLVFYVVCVAVHSRGGRALWTCIMGLAVTSMALLLIYVLGSIKFANLAENAPLDPETNSPYEQWFHGGMYEFMHVLPLPCWFFVGIQSINVACTDLIKPKSDVPKGYMAAMCTTLCTSFSVLLIACSLAPGVPVLITRLHPMTRGYMHMFGITRPYAILLSLPATIASGFGFMYFSGQQLRAMGLSGMLNPLCAKELPGRNTPVGALVIGSVFGYALCLLIFFVPSARRFVYNISMLGAFATYMSIFVSFWIFRNHYPTITREFVSPLGLAGAVYGFAVFLLAFIAIAAFQETQVAICTFVVLSALLAVYYYVVVRKTQVFSEEEKTVMFKAYLIKGNASKTRKLKKGSAAQSGAVANGVELGRPIKAGANAKTPVSASKTEPEATIPRAWEQEEALVAVSSSSRVDCGAEGMVPAGLEGEEGDIESAPVDAGLRNVVQSDEAELAACP